MAGIKKIIDVAHPDTTEASPTSKPVLVSNRPIMQDPMMSKDEQSTTPEESAAPIANLSTSRLKIKPLSPIAKPESQSQEETPKEPEETPETPAEVEQTVPDAKATEPPAAKTAESSSEPVKQLGDAVKDGDAVAKAAEETAAKEAALQKLVDSKRYFLPIETLEKRRSKQAVVIGLAVSVLLTAAWLDIALDAGLLHVAGMKALTHFFS